MNKLRQAKQIREIAEEYGISEDALLSFAGMDLKEYTELINDKHQPTGDFDFDYIEQKNREFEEATFNEYFDWARTYRYALYR